MAQLFRYLFTDDRQKSEIFTFMIPSSFLLDVENDSIHAKFVTLKA